MLKGTVGYSVGTGLHQLSIVGSGCQPSHPSLRARRCGCQRLTVLCYFSPRGVMCFLPFAIHIASSVHLLLRAVKCYKSHSRSRCIPGATLPCSMQLFFCTWSLIEKFNPGDLGPASVLTGYVIPSVSISCLW